MRRAREKGLGLGLVLGLAVLAAAGCVQRRMTVRTNPPGAMVYVDDYPLGASPISTNFTYYGTRRIRMVKDGYETLTIMQPMWPAWYEIPPVDFVSENLLPGELRDQRDFCYQLQPQMVVPPEQLLARGEQLRRSQPCAAIAAPPPGPGPAVAPGVTPPAGPPPGAVPPGMMPLGPAPETIPAPQPQPQPVPQPQGSVPAQPGIGGQLPHPLPPP